MKNTDIYSVLTADKFEWNTQVFIPYPTFVYRYIYYTYLFDGEVYCLLLFRHQDNHLKAYYLVFEIYVTKTVFHL